VGRSNKKAFCYLLTPPLSSLTWEARRRLKAIEENYELGSGFNIALQDLDIRGAGNLLGGEQSGFIADVGYETYQKILDEAIKELKEEEFKDLFANEKKRQEKKTGEQIYVSDFSVDTDMEIMLPDDYVSSISERIRLYKELNDLKNDTELQAYESRLEDRFGPLPPAAVALLDLVRLKWVAAPAGVEKIILKNNMMVAWFVSDPQSSFYSTPLFISIMNFVNRKKDRISVKQTDNKLSFTERDVPAVSKAISLFKEIMESYRMQQAKQ